MRSLALLGRQDLGARQAFWLFHNFASLLVAAVNVLIICLQERICSLVSNDDSVRHWLSQIFWILALHTQTRISALAMFIFYIPLGKGSLRTLLTFATMYLVAAPIAGLVALSDVVTTSVGTKLAAVVGATSLAQLLLAMCNFIYIRRLDWHQAGLIINRRANRDKRELSVRADTESLQMPSNDPAAATAFQELTECRSSST